MSSSIIKPGPSLIEGASALASKRRALGAYPYQWQFPGPNSKAVLVPGSSALPAMGTPVPLVTYKVPEGMRLSLRGIVTGTVGTGFVEGSGSFLWTLSVTESGGNRNVENFTNVPISLGDRVQPFPIVGRLEFQSLNLLSLNWMNVSIADSGLSDQFVFAVLLGHLYPNSEAAQ